MRCNAMLRDTNLAVAANDDRAIEVLASGWQLVVDITVRCAFAADGTAQPGAARVDGAVCTELGRTRNGRTQNSSVATGVVWSLSLSKREEDGVRKLIRLWKAWPQ